MRGRPPGRTPVRHRRSSRAPAATREAKGKVAPSAQPYLDAIDRLLREHAVERQRLAQVEMQRVAKVEKASRALHLTKPALKLNQKQVAATPSRSFAQHQIDFRESGALGKFACHVLHNIVYTVVFSQLQNRPAAKTNFCIE
jgi:hypothetical protein